ncbi:MAG: alpha/beta hydrolase [Candidatus Lokiarchaeota archaeon]
MGEKYAKVNGCKICYEVFGEGNKKPIFLIHGFGAKKETWIAQIPELSKKYRVIIMDNRGAGKSDRPNENYTMKNFADDIAAIMDFLNIEKAHVAGWSFGGMIVQHFALNYPEKLDKLILLFTNYKGQGIELYKKLRHEDLDLLHEDPEKLFWQGARMGYYRKFRKEMENNPSEKFFGIWSVNDLIKESIIDPPTHHDIDNQAVALETHNTLKDLHKIENQTLLIAASHDRVCPMSTMKEMHEEIPNSEFHVIEKAGHSAPMSRTTEVNKIILEFLK